MFYNDCQTFPPRVHFSPVKLTILVSCMPFARRESKLEDEVEAKNVETTGSLTSQYYNDSLMTPPPSNLIGNETEYIYTLRECTAITRWAYHFKI